ncbi:MAG TPA: hypothetical protein VHI98_01765 [Vicinamibacterales bacterium]|jgi:hypothetical protein|nr:hypothetical protein [Vicinamibacterales bacterium]
MTSGLALLASAVLSTVGSPAAPATLSRTIALQPGTTISIDSTVGDVDIRGWDKPEMTVEVDAPAGLEPRVDEGPGAIRISAVQPNGAMDRTVRTKIAARVPAAATFDAVKLRDGRLTIDGLSGAITADVRHGGIRASRVRGRVRLETGFGDVTVESATLDEGGLLRLRAFNGDVRLTFARIPVDARILALTFNGKIQSDIPLARREGFGPRFGETTLGKGEPVVSIDVITGDIVIASGGAPPR